LPLEAFHGDFENGVGCLIGAHDGHVGGGPGEDEARIERLPAESVIARSIRAACNEGNFRNAAIADSADKFSAGLDDAGAFGVATNHETIDILEKDDWQPILVAVHDKAGGLFGAIDVEHAAKLERPVGGANPVALAGDDADGESAESSRAADEGLA